MSNEKSKEIKGEVLFTDGEATVKLVGIFPNGDVEVKGDDGECCRVTKADFEVDYSGLSKEAQEDTETKAKEISTPVQQELDYIKTQMVTVIGRFENGDYEICNNNNLDDTWRVPKDTFENTYVEVETIAPLTQANLDAQDSEVQDNETNETTANDEQKDSVSEESGPRNIEVTLSLNDLVGKSLEEIKAAYNMNELRTLAKACDIKNASQTGEDKLIGKLLAKA